ncbi:MAG: 6-phosphogluconolactonase, partial [Chloroflexota bacterium]
WSRVHVFWGDERCVPPDHADSNYRMARETLLDHVAIPAGNAHRIRGEAEPAVAADEYARELHAVVGNTSPRMDLIFLGMGDDGHTASLFPHSPAIHETTRWVVAVAHATPPPPLVARVTITPVVINAARQVAFLVAGAGKAERLRQVLSEPYQPDELPSQIVKPSDGELLWFVDTDAAKYLAVGVEARWSSDHWPTAASAKASTPNDFFT